MTTLSEKERLRYIACKKQIEEGIQTCFDTGTALLEIKHGKLYRDDFDNFEEFCDKTYKIGRAHAYRLIEFTEVKMSPIGDKIKNEGQAREVVKVPAALREEVIKKAEESGSITAASISAAAKTIVPKKEDVRLDCLGRTIPPDVVPDWDRAEQVATRLRSCASEIKVTVERGLTDKDIIFAELTNPTVAEASSLHYTLSQIMPHVVCPTCQGRNRKNCQLCRRRGWISKYIYNSPAVSKATKDILEKAANK